MMHVFDIFELSIVSMVNLNVAMLR